MVRDGCKRHLHRDVTGGGLFARRIKSNFALDSPKLCCRFTKNCSSLPKQGYSSGSTLKSNPSTTCFPFLLPANSTDATYSPSGSPLLSAANRPHDFFFARMRAYHFDEFLIAVLSLATKSSGFMRSEFFLPTYRNNSPPSLFKTTSDGKWTDWP